MGGVIFPLCGKYNVKKTPDGSHHSDVALLPFVMTPVGEELLLYSAQRMGLLDIVVFEDFLSTSGFFKLLDNAGCIFDDAVSCMEQHPMYYCAYKHMKIFAKEGPFKYSFYFEISEDGQWHLVKHWLGFHDVFVLFRGRMLDFEESLELVRPNEVSYRSLNNGGPPPQRIINLSVFPYGDVVRKRRFRAILNKLKD